MNYLDNRMLLSRIKSDIGINPNIENMTAPSSYILYRKLVRGLEDVIKDNLQLHFKVHFTETKREMIKYKAINKLDRMNKEDLMKYDKLTSKAKYRKLFIKGRTKRKAKEG